MSSIFHLYTCNNLTDLARCYVHHRRQYPRAFMPADLFVPEQVTVPTKGMAVWLEQFLVQQDEIVINLQFPYIRDKVNELLNHHFQGEADFRPELFTPEVMTWRIMAILKQSLGDFPTLERYLQARADSDDDLTDLRLYHLALRIAQVFDQYIVYKPDMLSQDIWPENNDWQQALWRKLCQSEGREITGPADKVCDFLRLPSNQLPQGLPPQTIFGVSVMSPIFLNFFKKLSCTTEVHFFYLNPCDEFWADQKSRWAHTAVDEPDEIDEHFENTLLGDFGQQGRQFFKAILDLDYDIDERTWEEETPAGQDPGDDAPATTLLNRIQHAIRTRTTPEPTPLGATDDSITVHNCHHSLRQVEILHDHLLALLKTNRYCFNDILVMAPDIAQYAVTIQAVFDQGPLQHCYAIGDRSVRHANRLAEAFLSILEISASRYELSRILKLLDSPALRRRFHFADQDVTTLRSWFSACRICWGFDAEDRRDLLDFSFANYSWRQGLDRLLLGLALEEDDDVGPALGQLHPLSLADTQEYMTLLGSFCTFLQQLRQFAENTETSRTIKDWKDILGSLLEDFFAADSDSAQDYGLMRKTVAELYSTIDLSEYRSEPIPFPVIKAALSGALESAAPYSPFLNGKITFCSLTPMRSIPCKVIAMLGMDEDQFPRTIAIPGFNLIAKELESSFRSRQLEDRYLFLEALLSASDKLLFYYHGQDEHRRRDYLPSTAITELLEFAQKITSTPNLNKALVQEHRLQAFDPHYFGLRTLPEEGFLRQPFSFHQPNASVAKSVGQPATGADVAEGIRNSYQCLVLPPEENADASQPIAVTLAELEKFFINASQVFLVKRLGFPPPEWDDDSASDFEPFRLDRLEETIAVRALARKLRECDDFPALGDKSANQAYNDLLARNAIPVGDLGWFVFQSLRQKAWIADPGFRAAWRNQERHSLAVPFDAVPQDLSTLLPAAPPTAPRPLRTVILTGSVEAAPDLGGITDCCFSTPHGKHLIRFYFRHLLLTATGGGRDGSRLLGNQTTLTLPGLSQEAATQHLRNLLTCYLAGHCQPLPIFERYSTSIVLNPNTASKEFYDSYRSLGDAADHYVQFLWGNDPTKLPENAAALAGICYAGLNDLTTNETTSA